jgi:hypothetical protein
MLYTWNAIAFDGRRPAGVCFEQAMDGLRPRSVAGREA